MQVKPHWLLVHVGVWWAPTTHTVPHAPQFEVSAVVSTQEELQFVVPTLQRRAQAPPEHTSDAPHDLPHCPQLFLSDARSTQVPLHSEYPALQAMPHCLLEQVALPLFGAGQTVPHCPQFSRSSASRRQASPHAV